MTSLPFRSPKSGIDSMENSSAPADGASNSRKVGSKSVPGSVPPRPLSLADALARNDGDHVAALDKVLTERNQYALETAKLNNENVRIWNLMGRIRKENEAMKAKVMELKRGSSAGSGNRNSPLGPAAVIAPGSSAASRRRLPDSSDPERAGSPVTSSRVTRSNTHPDLASQQQGSPVMNDGAAEQQQPTHEDIPAGAVPFKRPPRTIPVTSASDKSETPSSSVDQGMVRSLNTVEGPEPPSPPGNSQQNSIMQQRAAAQAQFLGIAKAREQHAGRTDSLGSGESGDFEAVERSSTSGTDDGSRMNVSSDRGLGPLTLSIDSNTSRFPEGVHSSGQVLVTPQNPQQSTDRDGALQSSASSRMRGETLMLPSAQSQRSFSTRSRSTTLDGQPLGSPHSQCGKDGSRKNILAPRLDAFLLRVVGLKIIATNYRLAERGREAISFLITVEILQPPASWSTGSLSNGDLSPPTFWTLEKNYGDILGLDAKLRQKYGKKTAQRLAPLPDKGLFKDHAPAKVDQRKALLEIYLQSLLVLELPDKDEVCTFLCTDVVPNKTYDPLSTSKDGFLTKKGQNLGRWVTRFYVLRNSILNYYETRGGTPIGTINIKDAQIGRQQSRSTNESDENSYRHAFLILEKRPGNQDEQAHIARHVLCAESEDERDDWVGVLVRAIAEMENPGQSSPAQTDTPKSVGQKEAGEGTGMAEAASASSTNLTQYGSGRRDMVPPMSPRSVPVNLDQRRASTSRKETGDSTNGNGNGTGHGRHGLTLATLPASASHRSMAEPRSPDSRSSVPRESQDIPGSPASKHEGLPRAKPAISGPMNGAPIPTGYKFGAKDEAPPSITDSKKDDKKRFWHRFGGHEKNIPRGPRPVFGVPLSESVAISSIQEGLELPSVVYRCIEYLEKRNAANEEGIYRLSGSSAVIKTLKDRFNAEGDVDLLSGDQYYDPHAIAGLLKTFLRELPTSVLTRELHLEFVRVNEIADRTERVNDLGHLVSMLPLANYSLLRTLCSHLIKIIEHQDVNKMTMRNVGIVFSPTLAIGTGVFVLFLTEFNNVFFTDAKGEPAPRLIEEDIIAPEPSELGLSDEGGDKRTSLGSAKGRSKRNSLQYRESQAERLLGLENRRLSFRETEEDYAGIASEDGAARS